jgi:cysteine desulfurase / selenocysteine lyase
MAPYLDNAATSHPKPDSVYRAVEHALRDVGATPGRGAHRLAREAHSLLTGARESVAGMLGTSEVEQVLFTRNATESINIVLKGWLSAGDRVLVSSMEHNSVVRPLQRLSKMGVTTETISCNPAGHVDMDDLRKRMVTPPKLVVMTHASNVNGALQPIPEVAALCGQNGVPLLLDAAQTAGVQSLLAEEWDLGMLACSGHKSLLGPPGVGILYIKKGLDVLPLIEGGTGSRSEEALQPELCPDRYESGTPNLPGIAGLLAGIELIEKKGMEAIRAHELKLASFIEDELSDVSGVRVYKPQVRGTSSVSFCVEGMNPVDIGHLLDEGFDIAVRTGLHCAPLAHQTLGTYPEGTVRVSPGYSTTREEVELFLNALRSLLSFRR